MFLKTIVFSFSLTFINLTGIAQSATPIPSLALLPGVEISQTRTYTETSLYGYINGGAELYLEYGFDTLVVSELVSNGRDIKVEIYRMSDTEAAFGIFSVSRFRCNGGARLTNHMCRSAYQLQFCKGPFYVSIVNDGATEADYRAMNDITVFLLGSIPDPSFSAERFFSEGVDEETMRSAVLVRGPQGLFNGVPSLSDTFDNANGYSALIIREDNKTVASLRFTTDSLAEGFLRKNKNIFPADSTVKSIESAVSEISPNQIIIILN